MATPSQTPWREQRELFPEGVASGDPDSNSVLLWTRYPQTDPNSQAYLRVEIAEDEAFKRVISTADVPVSAAADWTCRVLVGGLKPAHIYWYRFTDKNGMGSRVGRTVTAPGVTDSRPIKFAFVSCQNVNQGAQNAYRRMIFEDDQASSKDRLDFILHLGDFIYEMVWYPEDRPQGMYDRRLRDVVRYPYGEKIGDYHVPTNVDDYRAVYRGYLHDPDIQDARARWPFINMWDNHEFSWRGWQSLEKYEATRATQTRKIAANQAFFEFQPARVERPEATSLEEFKPPKVVDAPITKFDDHGLGIEPNNLAAIGSLKGYRAIRWGRNVELIVTDQRTYRSEEPVDMPEAAPLSSHDFPGMTPQHAIEILDAGRTYNGGKPTSTISSNDEKISIPNIWATRPPQTILGAEQKNWFLDRLQHSKAAWKIWGNTTATLEMRADPQNLPEGLTKPWPWPGYAGFALQDWSTACTEKGEIYDFVSQRGITGFVTIAGDRHAFWAGLAAKSIPPHPFSPVGPVFVTGSISAPTLVEAYEHGIPKKHPLRALYVGQGPEDQNPQPTFNMLLRHGVRSCLEYATSGDVDKARTLSNPDLSPHASFIDMAGHGYALVRCTADTLESEFVCIPRPLERSERADGGPLNYRVKFHTPLWRSNEKPSLKMEILEGDPKFSI
ncbi:MAG TPA: alkaline phosphatase D family protein [Terriglobales bacterium]